MSVTVDKIARRMFIQWEGDRFLNPKTQGRFWHQAPEDEREAWRMRAREVLRELHEPTSVVIDAGCDALEQAGPTAHNRYRAKAVFEAMIDSALSPNPGGENERS